MEKKLNKTTETSKIIVLGLFVSIFYHFFLIKIYFGLSYPFDTFLFIPSDRFMDFINPVKMVQDFSPYIIHENNIPANYFPFAYLILYPFALIPIDISLIIFLLLFVISITLIIKFFIGKNSESTKNNITNLIIFSFCTYPFLFTFDRANIEAIVFIFESLFLIFYLKNKIKTAAIFLSFAAAMKFYPAFLAIIFLTNRQFKEFLLCAFSTIFISVIAMSVFNHGNFVENIDGFIANMKLFNESYTLKNDINSNGISLFSIFKLELFLMDSQISCFSAPDLTLILTYFSAICVSSYIAIFYYILKFEKILWKQMMLLTSCFIVFFNVSYDYKLISLLLPFLLYLQDKSKYRFDRFYLIAFALLLIPKQIAIKINQFDHIMLSNFFNLVILLTFMVVIVLEGIKLKKVEA